VNKLNQIQVEILIQIRRLIHEVPIEHFPMMVQLGSFGQDFPDCLLFAFFKLLTDCSCERILLQLLEINLWLNH